MTVVLATVAAYLLGSIPFGWLVGMSRGVDVRKIGSGNIGATNVVRALGRKAGALVFALDAAKGIAAVAVIPKCVFTLGGSLPSWAPLVLAAAVIVGHSFPVFLGFKGGKGVSTGLGIAIALVPHTAAIALAIWIVAFVATRYVSVSSIVAALFVAGGAWEFDPKAGVAVLSAVSVLALLVVAKHRSNIVRLAKGTENRFRLF